jgi:plastocyanin
MSKNSDLKKRQLDSRHLRLFAGVGLVLALLLAACQPYTPAAAPANTPASTSTPAPTQPSAPAATEQSPAAAEQAQVKLVNFSFSPAQLTVKAGTTVVWTNEDSASHTVTADDGSFDSGTLQKGASFSQTFSKPGEYPYYCRFHGGPGGVGMAGKIVVTE